MELIAGSVPVFMLAIVGERALAWRRRRDLCRLSLEQVHDLVAVHEHRVVDLAPGARRPDSSDWSRSSSSSTRGTREDANLTARRGRFDVPLPPRPMHWRRGRWSWR
jgi:hypothetical protein